MKLIEMSTQSVRNSLFWKRSNFNNLKCFGKTFILIWRKWPC